MGLEETLESMDFSRTQHHSLCSANATNFLSHQSGVLVMVTEPFNVGLKTREVHFKC